MGRRYLVEDQTILVNQHLTSVGKLNLDELEAQYSYVPNDKILFLPWSPYVDLYQMGKKRYDSIKYVNKIEEIRVKYETKIAEKEGNKEKQQKLKDKKIKKENKQYKNLKEGNLFMRMGEPLAIYDTAQENQTVENLTNYLHSKGYFNGTVEQSTDNEFKLVSATYKLVKNDPYIIDSIYYKIQDSLVNKLIYLDTENSLLKTGINYDQQLLSNERDRIFNLMLDNGYYTFSRNYISYRVDTTTLGNQKVALGIRIKNPEKGNHKVYRIDSINFTTDADIKDSKRERIQKENYNITFRFYDRKYIERNLSWRVFINQDSLFSKTNTFETQRQLGNVDIFKFTNIQYDTTGGKFIANINTSPLKKYQTSTEAGLKVTQGLPGPFFNASIKNRNTFRGLEILQLSGQFGFEGLSGASETGSPYSSLDYGVNLSITFPQFLAPLRDNRRQKLGRLNPKTRISSGLNFIFRPEYQRNAISSAIKYSWVQYEKNVVHNFALTEVNFIKSDLTAEYNNFLDSLASEGNNLIQSFQSAFVTSMWYSPTYNFNDYGNATHPSSYLNYKIETGGNSEAIYKEVATNKAVEVYKYAKGDFDFRHVHPLFARISFAGRFHTGLAIPYGENETLPYEKFYFSGGSNGIRAWTPRRLGPGSFTPVDEEGVYNNNYEQPGEIILETSVELRHKLFSFLYGAFFLDAGNTWTIRNDPTRPGAQFKSSNFFKEIAIGGGYGVRLDLSFLLLRLDAAWKLRDPGTRTATGELDRNPWDIPDYPGYSKLIWNIGIGYPF